MNSKVIMISDFNERAWAFEDALREFSAAEVTWMTARNSSPDFFRSLRADVLIIDAAQFDFSCVLHINSELPVILLVDHDDPIGQVELPSNMVVLNRWSNPSKLLQLYETVRYNRLTRISLLPEKCGQHV
ncbi:MAG: hypothetical protein ABL958_10285 [Bdellovibrionia bacterium]